MEEREGQAEARRNPGWRVWRGAAAKGGGRSGGRAPSRPAGSPPDSLEEARPGSTKVGWVHDTKPEIPGGLDIEESRSLEKAAFQRRAARAGQQDAEPDRDRDASEWRSPATPEGPPPAGQQEEDDNDADPWVTHLKKLVPFESEDQDPQQALEEAEDSTPLATFAELAIPRDFPSEDAPLGSWMLPVIQRQMRNMGGYPLLAGANLVPVGHAAQRPQRHAREDEEDNLTLARLQELGMLAAPRKSKKSAVSGGKASGSGQ